MKPVIFIGYMFVAVGFVALAALKIGSVAGAIVCIVWGFFFVMLGDALTGRGL